MKKTAVTIISLLLIMCLPMSVAASGTVKFSLKTSASQIRIGDTITITGSLSANQSVATFDLKVTYPTGNLQYVKAEGLSVGSSELDINPSSGSIQFLYLDSDGGGSGITSANIFRITFKVIGGNVGESVAVGLSVKTAGNSNAEGMGISGSGTSMTLVAPLSANNNLASLSISHGALSPTFSAATTSYNVSVPFDVSKLTVTATAADSTAQVSLNSPSLVPDGTTRVTVKVTAASGAEKVYTINVKRAQDPNYVRSKNNSLASLSVEGFLLSPVFDPNKTLYVVYLPFEVLELKVSASAADSKAGTSIEGHGNLKPGEVNIIKINCTAEDESVKIYTIAAVRAAEFTGLESLGAKPTPEPVATPTATPTATPSATPTALASAVPGTVTTTLPTTGATHIINSEDNERQNNGDLFKTILIVLLAFIALAEGALLIVKYKRRS